MDTAGQLASAAAPRGGVPRIPAYWVPIALYALGIAIYSVDLRVLVTRWTDTPGYSHGWLVAAAIPLLIWMARDRIGVAPPDAAPRRALAVGLAVAVATASALAHASGTNIVGWLAFPASVFLASWLVLGWPGARALALPLGYFVFAVPVWAVLQTPLQWGTIKAATLLLGTLGVRAYFDGPIVSVAAGRFEIAGGCGGLHFFVVALATAVLLAYVERLRAAAATRLIAAAIAIAVLANWVRVSLIIAIGDATAMRSSLVDDHYTFGWIVFAVGFVPFFAYARRVAEREPAPAVHSVRGAQIGLPWRAVLAAALLLGAGPAWVAALDARHVPDAPLPRVPPVAARWTGPEAYEGDWHPRFPGASAERMVGYRADGTGGVGVDALLVRYDRQEPERKLIGYLTLVEGDGWRIESTRRTTAPGDAAPLAELELVGESGVRRLLWLWYEVRGRRTVDPLEVKLRLAAAAFGARTDAGAVALSTRCEPDCTAARARLADLYAAGFGEARIGPRDGE